MANYMLCTSRPWGDYLYSTRISNFPDAWWLYTIEDPAFLIEDVEQIQPDKLFFVHWSEFVPAVITDNYECICFHPSNLPFFRGGTPIQHQIDLGKRSTKLTAFRMTQELDAGPIYEQRELSLLGSAEEIYLRMCDMAADMIYDWTTYGFPEPIEQGEPSSTLKRRKPQESRLPQGSVGYPFPIEYIFRFIEMLDAQDYPHAFIEYGGYRFEFTRPALRTGKIEADVTITPL